MKQQADDSKLDGGAFFTPREIWETIAERPFDAAAGTGALIVPDYVLANPPMTTGRER